MTIEIDARGLACPLPVVKTKKALEEIDEGDITVIIERPEGSQNVQRFADSQNCSYEVEEKDGLFHIHIHKGKTESNETEKSGSNVVLVTSDRLGTGSEELGKILMKAFLNTLWDASPKPGKILFINDGVRLTVEGSDVLDTLHLLENEGVEIYSCGTCLAYYELTEQLEVGQVTNMYETVESLLSSDKVIRI
jgi:selenium metabolism protein YedF